MTNPLSQPWTGSPEQRRAYFELKEAARRKRAQAAIAQRNARISAETQKRALELARQAERRVAADADRRARDAVARAHGQ